MFTMSPEQYYNVRIAELARNYRMSRLAVIEMMPAPDNDYWYSLYWEEVLQAVKLGQTLSPNVLGSLTPHNRRYVAHDYPSSIPEGYVLPEAQ